MKLTSKMAAILAGTLLLGACSNTSSNNILASVDPDTQISAADVYNELLKSSSGKSAVYQYIIREVIENNFPVTDAMETEADLTIENIQNSYTSYYGAQAETYLNQQLQQSGFSDIEDYRATMIYSFQLKEFLGKYIDENFDEVFEDYYNTKNPRYVSHILIKMTDPDNPTEEEKKKLDEVQALIDQGKDFAEIAKEYSDDTSASQGGALGICDADTNFVTEFKTVALKLKEGEISEATKSDYGYHFITVTSTDKETMKKDEQVLEERLPAYDSYMLYVALQDYDLTFADETIQEIFESQLAASLSARETSRNGGTN